MGEIELIEVNAEMVSNKKDNHMFKSDIDLNRKLVKNPNYGLREIYRKMNTVSSKKTLSQVKKLQSHSFLKKV